PPRPRARRDGWRAGRRRATPFPRRRRRGRGAGRHRARGERSGGGARRARRARAGRRRRRHPPRPRALPRRPAGPPARRLSTHRMDWLSAAADVFLHLDKHLNAWAGTLGPWLYVVLFVVIFCETGLVVTPFLPGDSLLFAIGALVSIEGSPLSLP